MDDLMSRVLLHKHAAMFTPFARVDIFVGHFAAGERAIESLRCLNSDIRVERIEKDRGVLWLTLGYERSLPESVIHKADCMITEARTLSAWSCPQDGRPGWLVDTPKGPRVLCPKCQEELGLGVRRVCA